MGDYTPVHKPGQTISGLTASAAVTGGQLVEITGDNTIGPAAAGSIKVIGQAAHDAAVGKAVTVHGNGRPICEATVSGSGVVAGVRLKAAANGQVALYVDGTDAATLVVGIALAAAANGALVRYQSE